MPNILYPLLIETAHTLKHRAAGADYQWLRGHSSGVNIPLIFAADPARFFA